MGSEVPPVELGEVVRVQFKEAAHQGLVAFGHERNVNVHGLSVPPGLVIVSDGGGSRMDILVVPER